MFIDLKQGVETTEGPPIVARFLYHSDLRFVLKNANKLRGKPFGIREQFPFEIEQRRRILYPIMKDAKRSNQQVTLVRDLVLNR
jgi:hypothetical protein